MLILVVVRLLLDTCLHPFILPIVHYFLQLSFFWYSLSLNNSIFYIFRAAVSDPEKNNSTIPPDVGPKQRKQMEFYNTRYDIAVKTKSCRDQGTVWGGGWWREEVGSTWEQLTKNMLHLALTWQHHNTDCSL